MPLFASIRGHFDQSGRFVATTFRQSSMLMRVLIAVGMVLLAGVGVILVIPLIFIAGIVLAIVGGLAAIRAKVFRAQAPNGVLDGRRNVRVREDGSPDDAG